VDQSSTELMALKRGAGGQCEFQRPALLNVSLKLDDGSPIR
jgi:hypothetical protein